MVQTLQHWALTVRKTLKTISWSICNCFSFSIVVHRFFFCFVFDHTPVLLSHRHHLCVFTSSARFTTVWVNGDLKKDDNKLQICKKKKKKKEKRWDRLITQTLVCFRSGSRTEDPKNGEWSSWVLWAPDGMPSSGARGGWGRWEAGWKTQTS